MKKPVKLIQKHSRTYLVPVIATAAAIVFWYLYRGEGYWWWIILICAILVINVWGFMSKKDEA